MMHFIKNNRLLIAGIVIGAIAGFFYWQQVGCTSGACMITSKWPNSTAYGALMGGLLFSMFKKNQKPGGEKKETDNE
jgi:uncharacterized protein YcfJ